LDLDAQTTWRQRHPLEWRPRDSVRQRRIEFADSLRLAGLLWGAVSRFGVRGSLFAGTACQRVADEHCRIVAVLAAILPDLELDLAVVVAGQGS
jgi:hypothetical protein